MTETKVGKLVVEVVGDSSGLVNAYKEAEQQTSALEKKLQSYGDSLTSAGKKMTLGVTAPIMLVSAGMVTLAGNAAETQSKFEQVFGAMSDDVEEWADTYGNAVGRATTDLQDMLATTDSIVKAMGLTDEAGAEFSETITQLSVDMASFHNSADIEAFNALRSAVTGEYEPMKRFGVVINEAKVEQELLNMGIKGGSKAATDAEKAQARLNLIMEATTDAQGDAERTAGSYSNQMKALKADITELGEEIGTLLIPAAQDLISTFRGAIQTFSDLDEGTQQTIVTFGLFAAAVGPATWALGSMAGGVSSMIGLYRTYQASTFAATVATRGFTAAIAANPVGLAIIGVTTLAAVLIPLIASTEDATKAQDEYNKAIGVTADLTEKTDEQLQEEIETLKEKSARIREQIEVLKNQHTPAVQANMRAVQKSSNETAFFALTQGDLTREFKNTTKAMNDGAYAIQTLDEAQQNAVISALELEDAETDVAIQIREVEQFTRDLADGAETAYEEANVAVRGHQDAVSDLQRQYDDLKETIDKALGIDEEIDDSGRDVERAEIRLIQAKNDLKDVQDEIKELEKDKGSGTSEERAEKSKELERLYLRERSAVLDLADAEDRLSDAQKEQQNLLEEKTAVEEELNGESIDSAQARLEEIGKALEEETEKLNVALEEREAAQIAHENLMNQIEIQSLETKSENWKKYVEYVNNNPAIARTYNVEYDENGHASYNVSVPTITIEAPKYSTLDLIPQAPGNNNDTAAASANPVKGGNTIIINQEIKTTTQSATEVAAATKKGLQNASLEMHL